MDSLNKINFSKVFEHILIYSDLIDLFKLLNSKIKLIGLLLI